MGKQEDREGSRDRRSSYQDRMGLEETATGEDDRVASMKLARKASKQPPPAAKKTAAPEQQMTATKDSVKFKDVSDVKVAPTAAAAASNTCVDDKEIEQPVKEVSIKTVEEPLDDKPIEKPNLSESAIGAVSVPGTSSPQRPRPSSNSGASQVGAQAVGTDDIETGTVIVGGTVAHAQPVTQDILEDKIREEIQAEIRDELQQAEIGIAQEIDPSSIAQSSGQKEPFCTKRVALVVVFIICLGVTGLVLGLLLGRDSSTEDPFVGNEAGDRFADYIVMSKDGKTLAAGSDQASYARVFRRNEETNEWKQLGSTLVGDGQFGRTMDFNRNGSMLVVGSWSNDDFAEKAGRAEVFLFNGTDWGPTGQVLLGDASQDRFGYFVAMSDSGDRIAVSARNADPDTNRTDAGIVRIYGRNNTDEDWAQLGQTLEGIVADEQFGKRIGINENMTRIAVSGLRWNGPLGEKQGRIRTFDYQGGLWVETVKHLEGRQEKGWWGSAISMTSDGTLLAVGSDGADDGGDDSGFLGVFQLEGNEWKLRGNAIAGPGNQIRLGIRGVPLSDDGNCLAAGGSHYRNKTGIGYLFKWENNTWHNVVGVVGDTPGDRFGGSTTLSGDCKWVAWGANQKESQDGRGYFRVFAVEDLL